MRWITERTVKKKVRLDMMFQSIVNDFDHNDHKWVKPALLCVKQITGYATTNEQRIVRSSVFTEKPQHDLEFRGRFSQFPIHRPVLKFQSSLQGRVSQFTVQ